MVVKAHHGEANDHGEERNKVHWEGKSILKLRGINGDNQPEDKTSDDDD